MRLCEGLRMFLSLVMYIRDGKFCSGSVFDEAGLSKIVYERVGHYMRIRRLL